MPKNFEYTFLSYPMNENTPLYGGKKGVKIKINSSIEKGDSSNSKVLSFNNHSGTHVDFPNHFIKNGKTSEQYDISDWIFTNPFLIELVTAENELINFSENQINKIPKKTDFIILKTGFGAFRGEEKYWKNNPGLSPDLANKLRTNLPNLKVIGLDLISITSYQNRELGRIAHRNFLGGDRPILLIEDMNLIGLNKSPNKLICAPLLIEKLDGTPITIIAES